MNSEDKEWLGSFLKASELAGMQQVMVRVSTAREISLADLVVGWRRHVLKMESDLPFPDSNRTTWGIHDFVAALFIRDFVASGLGVDPDCSSAAALAVSDVDEKFLSFTELDDAHRLRRIDNTIVENLAWWWKRIPIHGPMRRELDAIVARLAY